MATDYFINDLGRHVAQYRSRYLIDGATGVLSQERLAQRIECSRTAIAHLEEGRELPPTQTLIDICTFLKIPEALWLPASDAFYLQAMQFQQLLSEMVGKRLSLQHVDGQAGVLAVQRIRTILQTRLTDAQFHHEFNSLLVFYGERPVSGDFFKRYLGTPAFVDLRAFETAVRNFQGDAMRLYGSFRRAWSTLSRHPNLASVTCLLDPHRLTSYHERTRFDKNDRISPERLADLGYIAVARIEKESQERTELSNALSELARQLQNGGRLELPQKRRARINTLLRRFESPLAQDFELQGTLFQSLSPGDLQTEATRIAPASHHLAQISQTQQRGLRNLSVYLSEPHMDVYVATSMRADADFRSVDQFVERLFQSPNIEPLHLRYFNPTQSWIGDRVAKGLVEALMLRRSKVTVYMAQKGDTFGKDSEASVALGQGKTVIVYVPRLFDEGARIDSERTYQQSEAQLRQELSRLKVETEEGLDQRELASTVLRAQLSELHVADLCRVFLSHGPDFDLMSELSHIQEVKIQAKCREFLGSLNNNDEQPELESLVKDALIERLIMTASQFESRAKTFRDVHPLALQVIVETGVLNGIMVARSVETCARLIHAIVENTIRTEVKVDEHNYRLIEAETKSTLRVVSRHELLTNAFWTQYFDESRCDPPRSVSRWHGLNHM